MNLHKSIFTLAIISILAISITACKTDAPTEKESSTETTNTETAESTETSAAPVVSETTKAPEKSSGIYEKDGLSFQYPTDWVHSETDGISLISSPDGQNTISVQQTPTEDADGSTTKIEMGGLLETEGTLTAFEKTDREINGNNFTVANYEMLDIGKHRVQYFTVKNGIRYNIIITTLDPADPVYTGFESSVTLT